MYLPKKLMGRASTIARTEGGALAQFGQYDAVESSGLIVVKEWQQHLKGQEILTLLLTDKS